MRKVILEEFVTLSGLPHGPNDRVARGACTRRGSDRRVDRNPATLVTPWPFDTCISICA
jgi:hypothetical protein